MTRLIRYRAILYSCLGALFVVCTILAFTPIGFPYSDNQNEPRLQRFRAIHLKRTIYNSSLVATDSRNNVMIYAWDRNAIRTLENAFGAHDILYLQNDELCDDLYMCGFPHYGLSERTVALNSFNDAPNIEPTKFTLLRATRNGNSVSIEFQLELRTLTMVSVTAGDGLRFVNSNVPVTENFRNDRHNIVVDITFGLQRNEPYNITVEYEVKYIFKIINN